MKKKIFITFSLILIFLYILSSSIFASSSGFKYTFEDRELNIPDVSVSQSLDFKPNYFLFMYLSPYYYFFASENPGFYDVIRDDYNNIRHYIVFEGKTACFQMNKVKGDTSWTYSKTYDPSMRLVLCMGTDLWKSGFKYSNYNITYNGELIHSAYIPKYSKFVTNIRSIDVFDTVMKDIISVLPVTLTIVVSLVGIRKAINFIQKKLRSA